MKSLTLLIFLLVHATSAYCEVANKRILSLDDIDSDEVQKIELFGCYNAPNIISDCPFKIRVLKRDGRIIEKRITSFTGDLINETRRLFSFNSESIITESRHATCRMIPFHFPELKMQRMTEPYGANDAAVFTTVLSADDCSQSTVIRPESENGYQLARQVRNMLLILANEVTQQMH